MGLIYLSLNRFSNTFPFLVILPHGPQRAGDADGGVAAGQGAEHHGQCKGADGADIIDLGKDIDHCDAEEDGQICVDGTHHGLVDAEINQFLGRGISAQ